MTLNALAIALAAPTLAVAGFVTYGALRWRAGTRSLRARLEAARQPMTRRVVDFADIADLPVPVQRFFRAVLVDGQPMVTGVRLRHRGHFNVGVGKDRWRPFSSDQQVVTRRPGFDWDGRVSLGPGLAVRVHDAYVAGEGVLHAALLGAITVANEPPTPELAEGELMRFLAEAAWYPTVLLPSQGVRWEAIDADSARATLVDGAVRVTLLFRFDAAGLIETVQAEARGRRVGERIVPTPWLGRFWNYAQRDGMRVPLEGEVAWVLPEGARPYWRGRIDGIEYEFAQ